MGLKKCNLSWVKRFTVQRFRGSKVQRFKGSEVQRFRGSEVQRFRGSKVQRFKGSEVGPSFNYPYEFNDIGNKREAINPEP